jgi:hypothetical protein
MELLTFVISMAAALTLGLLAGNELAVAAFAHPPLYQLPTATHTQTARELANRLGYFMPFWYAVAFILTALLGWRVMGTPAVAFVAGSAAIQAGLIAYTVLRLVPINNRVAAWNLNALPENWETDRRSWDALHRWRVAGLVLSFGLLLVGIGFYRT